MFGTKECPDCDEIDVGKSVFYFHNVGNGKCNICHGEGHTILEATISDFVSEQPPPCWKCHISGDCQTCGGEGIIAEDETSEAVALDREPKGDVGSGSTEEHGEDDDDDTSDPEIEEDDYCYIGGMNRNELNTDNTSGEPNTGSSWNIEVFHGEVFTPGVVLLLFLAALISVGVVWNVLVKRASPQAVGTGSEDANVIPAGQSAKHRRSEHTRVIPNSARPHAHLIPSRRPDHQTVQAPNSAKNPSSGTESSLDFQPTPPPSDRAEQADALTDGAFGNPGDYKARTREHTNNVVGLASPIILWARHRHAVGGCSGQLQLWKDELKFIADHQLRLKRSDISSIDGPGFVDKSGKKWHFKVEGKTDAEFHGILLRWKEELN